MINLHTNQFKKQEERYVEIGEEWKTKINQKFNLFTKEINTKLKKDNDSKELVIETQEKLNRIREAYKKGTEELFVMKRRHLTGINDLFNSLLSSYSKNFETYHKERTSFNITKEDYYKQSIEQTKLGLNKNSTSLLNNMKKECINESDDVLKTITEEEADIKYSISKDKDFPSQLIIKRVDTGNVQRPLEKQLEATEMSINDSEIEGYDSSIQIQTVPIDDKKIERRSTDLIYTEERDNYLESILLENILSLEPKKVNYMNSVEKVFKMLIPNNFFDNYFDGSEFYDTLILFKYSFIFLKIFEATDSKSKIDKLDMLKALETSFLKVYPNLSFLVIIANDFHNLLALNEEQDDSILFLKNQIRKYKLIELEKELDKHALLDPQTGFMLNDNYIRFTLNLIREHINNSLIRSSLSIQKQRRITYTLLFLLSNKLIKSCFLLTPEGELVKYRKDYALEKQIQDLLSSVTISINNQIVNDYSFFDNAINILLYNKQHSGFCFTFTNTIMLIHSFSRNYIGKINKPIKDIESFLKPIISFYDDLSTISDISKKTYILIFSINLYESKLSNTDKTDSMYQGIANHLFDYFINSENEQIIYNQNQLETKVEMMEKQSKEIYLDEDTTKLKNLTSYFTFYAIFRKSLNKEKNSFNCILKMINQIGINTYNKFSDNIKLDSSMEKIDENIEYYLLNSEKLKDFFSNMINSFIKHYLPDISLIVNSFNNESKQKETDKDDVEKLFGMDKQEYIQIGNMDREIVNSFTTGIFFNLRELFINYKKLNSSRIKSIIPIVNIITGVKTRQQSLIVY